ncbi:hypothetical protein [Spirosoma jeollabukense]
MTERAFKTLIEYLGKVPAIQKPIGFGADESGLWWVKFKIDITNPLAWHVVQEVGHVCNYLSAGERLPTLFYPVSPPAYLPEDFLSWVIETKDRNFKPGTLLHWLEGRLPRPVEDLSQWQFDEDEEWFKYSALRGVASRRQGSRPGGGLAAQPNRGVKVRSKYIESSYACPISPLSRWVNTTS